METTETSVASLIKSDCLITEADEFVGDLYNKDPVHMAKINALILAGILDGIDSDILKSLAEEFKNIKINNPEFLNQVAKTLDNIPLTAQFHENQSPLRLMELFGKDSAARCARVSYLNHNGNFPSYDENAKLYDKLVGSKPEHYSPLEHQAIACEDTEYHANLRGWKSQRTLREEGKIC